MVPFALRCRARHRYASKAAMVIASSGGQRRTLVDRVDGSIQNPPGVAINWGDVSCPRGNTCYRKFGQLLQRRRDGINPVDGAALRAAAGACSAPRSRATSVPSELAAGVRARGTDARARRAPRECRAQTLKATPHLLSRNSWEHRCARHVGVERRTLGRLLRRSAGPRRWHRVANGHVRPPFGEHVQRLGPPRRFALS